MNVFVFVLMVSSLMVAMTLGIDITQQIWVEKTAARTEALRKRKEAIETLQKAIQKRFNERPKTIPIEVVKMAQKPARGRHRGLSAA